MAPQRPHLVRRRRAPCSPSSGRCRCSCHRPSPKWSALSAGTPRTRREAPRQARCVPGAKRVGESRRGDGPVGLEGARSLGHQRTSFTRRQSRTHNRAHRRVHPKANVGGGGREVGLRGKRGSEEGTHLDGAYPTHCGLSPLLSTPPYAPQTPFRARSAWPVASLVFEVVCHHQGKHDRDTGRP